MKFTLQIRAALPTATNRKKRSAEKHEVRMQVHQQLAELWRLYPTLSAQLDSDGRPRTIPATFVTDEYGRRRLKQEMTMWEVENYTPWADFQLNEHHFVPLVTYEPQGWLCYLDIRFLRRGRPGQLLGSQGDLDNQLKVLLDGLRVPQVTQELLPGATYPNPMLCLLEDDSLIAGLSIDTQTLLAPAPDDAGNDWASVHVEVRIETSTQHQTKFVPPTS